MAVDIDLIPFTEKEKALASLSEDQFRDKIVRPLFLKKKFRHGEEMCGHDEEGKDCYFTTVDPLGVEMVYAIQTKAGKLTMASDASKNLLNVITQMRMLMSATIADTKTKRKRKPNVGILCASGKINQAARKHICDEVGEPNIRFMDVNEIVEEVDAHFPEYWQGISADRNPYLQSLHDQLIDAKDVLSLANILSDLEGTPAVSEEGFANLRLSRTTMKRKKAYGKITQEPSFEEIAATTIFNRKQKHFLIKGDPGFGKSTLLRRLAECMIQRTLSGQSDNVPVILRATNVVESALGIGELSIIVTKQINHKTDDSGFNTDELSEGKVTLLIDALDEVAADGKKEVFVSKLNEFVDEYPKARIVITSRVNSFINKNPFLATFEEWNILPLALKDAQFMLDCAAKKKVIPSAKKGEVLRQLEKIHGIEINPLLVTVMIATTESSRKDIPANITELFSKFCEMMLGRWDSKKGFSQQFESQLKHRILGNVALEMHNRRSVSLPRAEFETMLLDRLQLLTKTKEKVNSLFDEIVHRSGLLRETEGNIEFRHLLVQEYFAGSAIRKANEVLPYLGDEWWRRVVIFYFGSNPEDGEGLLEITVDSNLANTDERFSGAVTIGLASQACYFVDIPDRLDIYRWVIKTLSDNKDCYLNSTNKYPIHDFLYHYLSGRDALASELIEELVKPDDDSDLELPEHEKFWIIAGLIEADLPELALECIDRFDIKDRKLLMGLHIGAFTLGNGRIASKETKKTAALICEKLDLFVAKEKVEFLKEFKNLMLEVRNGEIVEVDELAIE